ncbi:Dedicator of cytokinesis protein 2 [Homalodisca vitripennis]|nr:Dedicator of cytokinesis protein 2 [Homalodisca vitripennis]
MEEVWLQSERTPRMTTTPHHQPTEVTVLKQPHIVQELTSVLREWGTIWKHLYITHNENFKKIEHSMYELMKNRSQILSGTLPVDELKQVKILVTAKIDMGNKLLGLDMVVRDEHGNILNPEQTSTIQLYKHHEKASERIRKANSEPMNKKVPRPLSQQLTHTLFVSMRNFVCKMADDAELLMTLYDGKENRAFTESYVVRWSREGLAREIDQMHNLRVLFTDLGSRDLGRERVYLVCYVVRLGGMEVKEPDKDNKKHSRQSVSKPPPVIEVLRRPYGVAAMDITLFVAGKMETDEDKHHFLPFLPCEKDNLEGTLKRILANKELTQRDHKGQGLYCSFKMLHGDIKQVREENPHLVLGQVATARKMGFPEVILPDNVRNDLYLTLVNGEFSKGSKSTDKNVEVTVRVCSEKGQALQLKTGAKLATYWGSKKWSLKNLLTDDNVPVDDDDDDDPSNPEEDEAAEDDGEDAWLETPALGTAPTGPAPPAAVPPGTATAPMASPTVSPVSPVTTAVPPPGSTPASVATAVSVRTTPPSAPTSTPTS